MIEKNHSQSWNVTKGMGAGNHVPLHTGGFISLNGTKSNGKLSIVYLYVLGGWISGWLINLYNKFKRITLFCFSIIFLYFKLLIWLIDFVRWIELKVNKRQHLAIFYSCTCCLYLTGGYFFFLILLSPLSVSLSLSGDSPSRLFNLFPSIRSTDQPFIGT